MTQRSSYFLTTLAKAIKMHGSTGVPMSAAVSLRIADLLAVVASQCLEMERRLAGEEHPQERDPKVVSLAEFGLNRPKPPAGDA